MRAWTVEPQALRGILCTPMRIFNGSTTLLLVVSIATRAAFFHSIKSSSWPKGDAFISPAGIDTRRCTQAFNSHQCACACMALGPVNYLDLTWRQSKRYSCYGWNTTCRIVHMTSELLFWMARYKTQVVVNITRKMNGIKIISGGRLLKASTLILQTPAAGGLLGRQSLLKTR